MSVSKTSDHIHIKIKMPNPSQEPPAPTKAPNQDLKDMDVLCTFKTKIERWNSEYGCIRDQWPFPYQDQDAKPFREVCRTYLSKKHDPRTQAWVHTHYILACMDPYLGQIVSNFKDKCIYWKQIWIKLKFYSWPSLSKSQAGLSLLKPY